MLCPRTHDLRKRNVVCGIADVSQNDLPGIEQHACTRTHTEELRGHVIDARWLA
jgi:hypothetical protein